MSTCDIHVIRLIIATNEVTCLLRASSLCVPLIGPSILKIGSDGSWPGLLLLLLIGAVDASDVCRTSWLLPSGMSLLLGELFDLGRAITSIGTFSGIGKQETNQQNIPGGSSKWSVWGWMDLRIWDAHRGRNPPASGDLTADWFSPEPRLFRY